jgi:flavorubredoxin
MARELELYLASERDPAKKVTHFLVDGCGMTDAMLAAVLRGLRKQGTSLISLACINHEVGVESFKEICKLICQLHELIIANVTKNITPPMMKSLLDATVQ